MLDRKEALRLHWLISIYMIEQKKNDSFSFNNFEEAAGYPKKCDNGNPQSTFRYFLRELVTKGILVKHDTFKTHPRYRIDKKLLIQDIESNNLMNEVLDYIEDSYFLVPRI